MKKFFLLAGLAMSLGGAMQANAQVRISVNIGTPMPVMQQSWYGNDCDYYYMPDQGVYYNVNRGMYVWPNGGNWMCGPSLPPSYGNCTWGNSRYYAFRGRSPFMRHDYYRNQYGYGGRGGYAYGNGRGPGGRWDDRRGDGRWDNRGGGRGWNRDRGGDRNWGNNGGGYNGGNGNGGYNGNNGGYNGNNNGGYNNGNGGGRGGWDRR